MLLLTCVDDRRCVWGVKWWRHGHLFLLCKHWRGAVHLPRRNTRQLCKHLHYAYSHHLPPTTPPSLSRPPHPNELSRLETRAHTLGGRLAGAGTSRVAVGGSAAARGAVGVEQQIAELNELMRAKFEGPARQNPAMFADAYRTCIGCCVGWRGRGEAAAALRTFGRDVGCGGEEEETVTVTGEGGGINSRNEAHKKSCRLWRKAYRTNNSSTFLKFLDFSLSFSAQSLHPLSKQTE